jgi:hypothetical protein
LADADFKTLSGERRLPDRHPTRDRLWRITGTIGGPVANGSGFAARNDRRLGIGRGLEFRDAYAHTNAHTRPPTYIGGHFIPNTAGH